MLITDLPLLYHLSLGFTWRFRSLIMCTGSLMTLEYTFSLKITLGRTISQKVPHRSQFYRLHVNFLQPERCPFLTLACWTFLYWMFTEGNLFLLGFCPLLCAHVWYEVFSPCHSYANNTASNYRPKSNPASIYLQAKEQTYLVGDFHLEEIKSSE